MMNSLIEYQNGNYLVRLLTDGTKIRLSNNDNLIPEFPESLDIKITNYCDAGCKYCHEQSTIAGKHADLDFAYNTLKDLPAGSECALGGGDPMQHPDLEDFLIKLNTLGLICNITINEIHIEKHIEKLKDYTNRNLIKAIGISFINNIEKLVKFYNTFDHCVIHIIIGCHSSNIINTILDKIPNARILLLGYKTFGRGIEYNNKNSDIININIQSWYKDLRFILDKTLICFDNLAVEQLNPKRLFLDQSEYNVKYMGNDGQFSMYIDFVKQEYSKASFCKDRLSISSNIKELFNIIKHNANIILY